MISAIKHWLLALIGLALTASVAELIVPHQGMKKIIRLVSAVCIAVMMCTGLLKAGYADYASALQYQKLYPVWDADAAAQQNEALNRTLIEQECSAYILDKADSLGIPILEASVSVRWDTRGYWVPDCAVILVSEDAEPNRMLSDAITAELGISADAQEWRTQDET